MGCVKSAMSKIPALNKYVYFVGCTKHISNPIIFFVAGWNRTRVNHHHTPTNQLVTPLTNRTDMLIIRHATPEPILHHHLPTEIAENQGYLHSKLSRHDVD